MRRTHIGMESRTVDMCLTCYGPSPWPSLYVVGWQEASLLDSLPTDWAGGFVTTRQVGLLLLGRWVCYYYY